MRGLSPGFDAKSRRLRVEALVIDWLVSDQAKRIGATLGPIVLGACKWEVQAIADRRKADERGAIVLTKAQVTTCEQRVVSQARVAAHGPWALQTPDGGDRWKRECELVRISILKGIQPIRIGEPQDAMPANLEEIISRPPTEDQQRTMAQIKAAKAAKEARSA